MTYFREKKTEEDMRYKQILRTKYCARRKNKKTSAVGTYRENSQNILCCRTNSSKKSEVKETMETTNTGRSWVETTNIGKGWSSIV